MFWVLKLKFLHKIHYAKLFEAIVKGTKIHVQIMRFTSCLNMGFNSKRLKMTPVFLSDITWVSVVARTDHYVNVFVHENLVCVMTL